GITRDPGFDLWCGDSLCAWKLERGHVFRVPTWHTADSGVELVEAGTAIEQFTAVDSDDGTCIQFDMVTDVGETAQATLAIDVYGDGTVERTYPIPSSAWLPFSYRFAVKPPFTGIRFELAKTGSGRMVVARIRAKVIDQGCEDLGAADALDGGPAPLAARCDAAGDCASAICAPIGPFGIGRCEGCDPLAPACGAGQVCGYAAPGPAERSVPLACVASGARSLGEQCWGNAECATGICRGFCSACRDDAGCGGAACLLSYVRGPYVCGAGQRTAPRGAPCAAGADCASGACNGALRRQCLDGRACASDANCPVGPNLAPGPCDEVGIQGGSCD
ncbi:MAG TPA: hypothetical protein VK601_08265, partial [Kofleriaceae bacterium]|nr:hypothetical protein [Kofleriaceae bacterium]